jgi:hypothetical protein
MANCGNKIKQTCNSSMYAICVKSELIPPPYSTLVNCFSTEEVDIDQYAILTAIKSEIDMTNITSTYGTLPVIKEVNDFIQYLVNIYGAQQLQIDALIAQNTTQASQIANLQSNTCP